MQLATFTPMVVMLAAAVSVQAGPIAAAAAAAAAGDSPLLLAAREPKCQVIPPSVVAAGAVAERDAVRLHAWRLEGGEGMAMAAAVRELL
ncbi:uncharacterized protein PG986_003011 [Apiospora aurea]|uniref:Secreted protein n=1 Tax=Apiospora aurea TaxID=335848 RepID=A0ABR1QS18_9PEZI